MAMKWMGAAALVCGLWPAAVAADENDDDLKCLVVSMALVQSGNPDDQSVGMLSTLYWLGRLDGRDPKFDVGARAKAAADGMKPDDMKLEAARCSDVLSARGELLTNMGGGPVPQRQVPD